MLHIGHIDHPGGEAGAAVELLRAVYREAGAVVQVAIYDGAFRGKHIDEVMRRYGLLTMLEATHLQQ